ncbi:MAG: sensor histidine kinase [Nitrospira sp.]|nr:sensor histidine kinase [Nitrospira sp.]
MDRLTTQEIHDRKILTLVVGLSCLLFAIDLFVPLGIAIGVLYAGVVVLVAGSANPRLPFLIAVSSTPLIIAGAVFSPHTTEIPLWVGVSNRIFALIVLWVAALLLQQRQRAESQLRQAKTELETRVETRTKELADLNQTLMNEISGHIETEGFLRASEQALATSRQELRDLTARLLTVQEEERRRISRDLHDDINQRLAMLVVQAESLEGNLPPSAVACSKELRSIQDRLTELSDDVRHLAYQFHPSILDDLGLPVALQRLVDDCTVRSTLEISLEVEAIPHVIPQAVSTCLYRIAQECLANVMKHAQASRATVNLASTAEGITLTVQDDGIGFDTQNVVDNPRGLGLISMAERVRLVHGTVTINSIPQHGTRLSVHVPHAEVSV